MPKLLIWLKNEIIEILPAVLFFMAAFNIISWTEQMMTPGAEIQRIGFLKAAIGALIVGKVLLIVDLLPVVNAYQNRPLIYNTLWKTFLYSAAALLFRLGEKLIPLLIEQKSLALAYHQLNAELVWPIFWGIQIWLLVLFLTFVSFRELINAVGTVRVKQLFFNQRDLTGTGFDEK